MNIEASLQKVADKRTAFLFLLQSSGGIFLQFPTYQNTILLSVVNHDNHRDGQYAGLIYKTDDVI